MTTFPEPLSNFKDEVEKTDDDGTLQIYSYKHCDNNSSDELKRCRGVVYNGEKLLVRSIGYTSELSSAEWNSSINNNTQKYTFYHSNEGTLIRVFYCETNTKWYVTTHRKLDAFRSRWGSAKSFGELFEEALGNNGTSITSLTEKLDKRNVYLFLLSSTSQTRMVCAAPEKIYVLHVGTLVNGQTYSVDYSVGIPVPFPIQLDARDIASYAESLDPRYYQGVIAFSESGDQIKIVNTNYKIYSQARGNEPSVMFRYLKIRSNATYNRMMFELYPDYKTNFVAYENIIYKIAKTIHAAYINRFVNKQQVVVSQEEYRFVKECHSFHIKDREHNKVTLAFVLSVLSMPEYVSTLNSIIKKLKA